MVICPQCGHENRCERCNQYACERCGADLPAGVGGAPRALSRPQDTAQLKVEELRATLLRSLELCLAYERIRGQTRTTRELAWQQRKLTERALALLGATQRG